jgi:hypothetical protein
MAHVLANPYHAVHASPRLLASSLILLLLKLIATHPTNSPNMIIMGIRQPYECLRLAWTKNSWEALCTVCDVKLH